MNVEDGTPDAAAQLAAPSSPGESVRWSGRIVKAEDEKRFVLGVALEPDSLDAHGDHESVDDIEEAAHRFLIASKVDRGVDDNHEDFEVEADVVESYIARTDMVIGRQVVVKGSWLVGIKVWSDELWAAIKSGERDGLSVVGWATKEDRGGAAA